MSMCIDESVQDVLDNMRRLHAATVVQAAHDQAAETVIRALHESFGDNYIDIVCLSLGEALRKSLVFELFSVQPFRRPAQTIWTCSGGRMKPLEGRAETRKLKHGIALTDKSPLDQIACEVFALPDERLVRVFVEALCERSRYGLACLMNTARETRAVRTIDPVKTLLALIDTRSPGVGSDPHNLLVHPDTMDKLRAKINVQAEPERIRSDHGAITRAGVWERNHFYVDDQFHRDEILLYRRPTNPFDGPLIWSPYYIGAAPGCAGIALRMRDLFTLTEVADYVIIE